MPADASRPSTAAPSSPPHATEEGPAESEAPGLAPAETLPPVEVLRVPYAQTGRFSKLVVEYLEGQPELRGLAPFAPTAEGLDAAMEACIRREANGHSYPRAALREALDAQYAGLDMTEQLRANIDALGEDALCVVTAHQLNLFGGPLYLIHKTVAAIRLAETLQARQAAAGAQRRVVPVFWLGSEDHDFAEVDHFRLFGKTLRWEDAPDGAEQCSTGGMPLQGLEALYAQLDGMLRDDPHAESLRALFRESYLQGGSYAEGQRRFLHTLFGRFGLVVLNADTPALKAHFAPVLERELSEGFAAAHGAKARQRLDADWHVQAEPRPINLFYRAPVAQGQPVRERVDLLEAEDGARFQLAESGKRWTLDEALELARTHPERFSPNVQLRPLYQQSVLPAVAFLGGGSEVAYWLPLRDAFEAADIFMPAVLLRQSFWWLDRPSAERLESLDLKPQDLFGESEALVQSWVRAHETEELSLEAEKAELEALYGRIADRAAAVDPSLRGKVEAEQAGQQKALDKLEGRLVKASKQRHETQVKQLRKLLDRHFPDGGLQERHDNMASLWLRHGSTFVDVLYAAMDPLDAAFVVVVEQPETREN